MKKHILLAGILATSLIGSQAFARADEPKTEPSKEVETKENGHVNLISKGKDVREVLTDLFSQAKKNFIIDQAPRTNLFLVLSGIEFEETLEIICRTAGLVYEVQNGIYFIRKAPTTSLNNPAGGGTPKLTGKLNPSVLEKKFTVRLPKTDYREVLKQIGKLTNLWIEVDPTLTGRSVDAFLVDMTLKQGLDMLTQALGLEYKFTETQSILIFKPDGNRITIRDNAN